MTQAFIDEYLERGFGSMNKNDFEVRIFSQLLQTQCRDMSNYDISIYLKIPENKVKRLRYEAELRYTTYTETTYKELFFEAIKASRLNENYVQFVVEDIAMKKYIEAKLKKAHIISDSSFNSEIVKLDIDDFVFLLKCFCDDNEQKSIMEKLKKKKHTKESSFEGIIKESIREFIKGAANGAGRAIFDLPALLGLAKLLIP